MGLLELDPIFYAIVFNEVILPKRKIVPCAATVVLRIQVCLPMTVISVEDQLFFPLNPEKCHCYYRAMGLGRKHVALLFSKAWWGTAGENENEMSAEMVWQPFSDYTHTV